MKNTYIKSKVAVAISLLLVGCATPGGEQLGPRNDVIKDTFFNSDPCANNSRNIGLVLGTVGGALISKAMKASGKEVLIGAAAGAFVGGLIGADMDRRKCELSKIAKKYDLEIAFNEIEVTLPDQDGTPDRNSNKPATSVVSSFQIRDKQSGNNRDQFLSGSDQMTPKAQEYFSAIADQYAKNLAIENEQDPKSKEFALKQFRENRKILLVGHTDDIGSTFVNADLSERRAKKVAEFLKQKGVHASNIYFQGAGEAYPIGNNRTEEGRAANRRVEIVEAADESAFKSFLEARQPDLALYRPTTGDSPIENEFAEDIQSSKKVEKKASSSSSKASGGSVATNSTTGTNKREAKPKGKTPDTAIASNQPKERTQVATAEKSQASSKDSAVESSSIKLAGKSDSSPSQGVDTQKSPRNPSSQSKSKIAALSDIDFGGNLIVGGNLKTVDIGKTQSRGLFDIISTAQANDDIRTVACVSDRPRQSGEVKNLSTGKTYAIREFLPGAAKASWGGVVNNHYIGVTPVTVLRDGTVPEFGTKVLIYKNWKGNSKPDASIATKANAYVGDKALLYRVFPSTGPIQCLDVVIDRNNPSLASSSSIIYTKKGEKYQADFDPTITRN